MSKGVAQKGVEGGGKAALKGKRVSPIKGSVLEL
jgi:hypothetical protein